MKAALRLAALVITAAALAGAAHAQGAAPGRRNCDPRTAMTATVEAVASDPKSWLGKCVTVKGAYGAERIYSSIDAVYGHGPSIGGFVDGRGSLYGFYQGEYTGRVADCVVAEADLQTGLLRSPGISLDGRTLGCVKAEGPFLLFMSQGDLKPSPWRRKLWRDVGAGYGDLVRAPADWPHLETVNLIAGDVLRALQEGNRELLNAFVKNGYATDRLLTEEDTAISKLRKPGDKPLQVWVNGPSSDTAFKSEACFCLTRSCAPLWPVARRDADNQFTRPYACVRIDGRKTEGWSYTVDLSTDYGGLREP